MSTVSPAESHHPLLDKDHRKSITRLTRLLRVLTYILVFIALVSVARRILAMNNLIPSFNPGGNGQAPHVFFGTAFWIGFTLHLILAETWINYTRSAIIA